jgi:two-component system, NarL family, sensor histidine kinase BarA
MQQDGLIDVLHDPARLTALHETALLETRTDEAFDRLTRVASKVLGAPIALVVLVSEDRQYFKSHVGLPEPYSRTRQTPLTHSFCQHIVLTREPLVVEDARANPEFRDNPAIRDLGVIAYLGVPLRTPGGHVLGSLCVIDHEPRAWGDEDVALMTDLAGSVMTEIELRLTVREAEESALGQAALGAMMAEIGGAARFRDVVRTVVERAVEHTRAFGAYVERADEPGPGAEVEVVAVAGDGVPAAGTRVPYPGSLTEEVIAAREPVALTEVGAIGESMAPYLQDSCRGCAGLVAPLRAEDRVLGALVVLRREGEAPFRPEEAAFVRALGDAASAAIRRVLLLEDLRESEQRFRELAENVREVFWVAEPDFSRFLYVSPAYEAIWGRSVESLYEDPVSYAASVHPADRDLPPAGLEMLKGGEEIAQEYRIVRPDGEVRWLWVRGFPVRNERGQPYRVVGVTEDITERKEREETLRFLAEAGHVLASSLDYEETFRSVARLAVESIADWCIVYVPDEGRVRRLAVAARDPEKERLAREIERRYPPSDGHPAIRVIETGRPVLLSDVPDALLEDVSHDEEHMALLRGMGLRSLIYAPLQARGETLAVIAFGAAESGRRYGADDLAFAQELAGRAALAMENASLYRDAERMAREEAALRQAAEAVSASFTEEEVIRQIARSALDATGADGAFVKQFDVERGEVEVVAVAGTKTPPPGSRTRYAGSFTERVVEGEKPAIIENISEADRAIAADLSDLCPDCSAMVVPLLDAGEPIGSLVLLRSPERPRFKPDDVARANTFADLASLAFRKVHLLQESERRREELERITESRARLMRGFSHDVKNPLGAADGYAQLLEEGILDPLTPRQHESVGRIRRSIRSGLRLIDDLLELARAEAGQIEIRHVPTDVREAVREMTEEYRAQAEAKGLRMEVNLPEEFPVVDSDAERVRQILGNLISNAVKYTTEGAVTVQVGTREDERAPGAGRWIAVDVSDTGPGIPRDKQHLLFQEFVRIQPGSAHGAGIGLAIGRRVACALGGDITLVSDAGEGSTFTLWLPLRLARDREAAA